MSQLILKLADGSVVGSWELTGKTTRFGRGDSVDVRIDDGEMSREHFSIESPAGDSTIRDLNSKNGTWVNGVRVSEQILKRNDQIRAGRTVFLFHESQPKGLNTMFRELEEESERTGKGFTTLRREIYKKAGA